ncbi:unnamed protein product [Aspergillus oryzae]|nr:unnamed protein product [Aspergillus oryzae]
MWCDSKNDLGMESRDMLTMPVARPSEQCPNIDPRQPGMVERGTIPSRLDRDASNGSIQVSHIFTDVSGHQTEGPSPQAAEQRSTEAPESHTYESYPVPIGPPVPMRVSSPEIPGFASASTFVNTFADMAPYSSGDGGVQDNMDEKSEDLDLPSAVMGDLLQYESIGPLELENPQHSRFEFEPLPSWQDTSRRSLNTPIGSVRYDYYDPLSYYDPPTDSELPSAVMGDLVLYEHIGPLELENPQHSRYDYEPLPSWQHIDRLPTLTTINESELHQASPSQSICPVEPLAVFDEEIIMRPEPSPEESEEDESEEDEPEALLSRTPPTSQLNQNAIPPSKPPPLDISSPPPSSGDRIDHLPSLPMALGGDLGVEGSTADPDNSRGVANPPLSSNTDSAPQCTLSIAAFTDSGYGSTIGESRQAKVIPTPIHGSVTGDILQETASLTTNDPSMDDVQTVYSNCSSISNSKKDVYVSALAEELSSYVRSYKPDAGVLDQMYEALPGFLKMFALSFAHNREALVYRDIMAFVHNDIVVALRNKLSGGPLVQRPSQDEDVMPLSEIINRWKSTTDEANEDVPDAVPELNSSRAMNTDGVIDLATIQTPSTDGPHYGSDIESNMESQNRPKPEDEAASKLPELVPYIQLICDSGAYTDLLANIQKACCLSSPQPNTMRRVRDVVLKVLPVKSFISRKRIPDSYSMIYTVGWDISAFVSQQGHDSAAETAIESSITLTGSPNELQALAFVLPDDSTIKAFPCYTYDTHGIMVSGPSYTIAQVGEVLTWLGSTFRTSPYSKGVVYREPFALKSKNLPGYPGAYVCHLDYVELKEGNGSGSQNGNCWQDLFRNPVVVKGYPIKRRRATAPGLEIPLRLMAELIQAKRMNPFAGNIVLKGFSTMLVPTAHEENTISWHLLRNKTGGRISYLSGMAISEVRISIPQLESSRHVLGWCADMKFYAGIVSNSSSWVSAKPQ